jgi:isocitrate/isopropylmalate dehydrogenase
MSPNVPMTVAHGDGIGPEIMQGLEILKTETLRTYNGAAGCTLSQGQ